MNALLRFELARRLFNHAAVLPLSSPILAMDLTPETLVAYAAALREIQATYVDPASSMPVPVLPVVDLATLTVSHVTCTGHTRIAVDHAGDFRVLRMVSTEPEQAGRDALLHALFATTWDGDPRWTLFLRPTEWATVGVTSLGPSPRLVSRHLGQWVLVRDRNDVDTVRVADGEGVRIYHDPEFTPDESDWMRMLPNPLRTAILDTFPDSRLNHERVS